MNMWTSAWQSMRILRWALWIASVAFYIYFYFNRAPHLTQFGHLKHSAEAFMFGLPIAAVIAGFLELMIRARIGGGKEV